MPYVPSTPAEQQEMLQSIGKASIEELLVRIPQAVRVQGELQLPRGKSEFEVFAELQQLAAKNTVYKTMLRGAGAYRHFIPSIVTHLAAREEFVTAYTPYQAEMSQGVLQSIFEYQTMITRLTGMEVSNAGVYDGAHAAAEAAALCKSRGRTKTLVSAAVNPRVLAVMQTYCNAAGHALEVIALQDGKTDPVALQAALDDESAGVYIESPNYYGLVEDCAALGDSIHAAGAKLIMGCNPFALVLYATPRECGADVAVGEAQPLGMPLSFGGPYLGYMAVNKADMRRLPGRIVGQTTDAGGNTAYVLTLQAREQHIRREKASSSICSNEALCALTATIYCAAMGETGLQEAARQCHAKAQYAKACFTAIAGFASPFAGETFHEFVTACPADPAQVEAALAAEDILCGLPVEINGKAHLLWCVTECVTKAEIDKAAAALRAFAAK